MRKVALVIDSPNLTRSVSKQYGPDIRPDFRRLREVAGDFGTLLRAEIIVNRGIPGHWATQLENFGFSVVYGTGPDCDDTFIKRLVDAWFADTVIVGGGDHVASSIVRLLQAAGKKVVVASVPATTSGELIASANAFLECPTRRISIRTVPLAA